MNIPVIIFITLGVIILTVAAFFWGKFQGLREGFQNFSSDHRFFPKHRFFKKGIYWRILSAKVDEKETFFTACRVDKENRILLLRQSDIHHLNGYNTLKVYEIYELYPDYVTKTEMLFIPFFFFLPTTVRVYDYKKLIAKELR